MQFVNVGYFLIAAGAVLFILGFLGCYGAHSDFTQVWNTTMEEVRWAGRIWEQTGRKARNNQSPIPFCLQLHCCGFNNYTDFNASRFVKENKVFPPPCCANPGNHTVEPCTEEKAKSMKVQVCAGMELSCLRQGLSV